MSNARPTSNQASPSLTERRGQQRISVQIPAALIVRGRDSRLKAVIKDLSWSGAFAELPEPLPPDARKLQLVVPWKRGRHINAMTQILRARTLQDGRTLIAVRLMSLSPRSHRRLERLLEGLRAAAPHQIQRGPTELVKELEISANDVRELRGMMRAIATGRYTCTLFEAYPKDQSLCFVLAGTEDWAGIRLRARVVDVKPTSLPGYADTHLFAVTLQFEHPRESLADLIEHILEQLPRPQVNVSSGLERSQAAPQRHAFETETRPSALAERPAKTALLSELEASFPEALNYLLIGWGDAEAFAVMVRELIIGERFQMPGGWPPEAWEEIMVLQDVHDLIYGVAESLDFFRRDRD